ncbi:MAG: hypothetical protein JXQ81_01340 [Desulfuromonadales bacterium]|nr:hypothetical protein [Desulfuromonadales bacterium]MBN2791130.1 hypothetical protein [Desulfuromonadales bacterium]
MLQTKHRLDKDELLDNLRAWNQVLRRKIHIIACGGTAMTLLGVKASTKDVDFMVPDIREYNYLIKQLSAMGYTQTKGPGWQRKGEVFHFDIFRGNNIHTTGLLESPLEAGRNKLLMEFSHLYIGILNDYDLISSKLMRGTRVDFEDCIMLATAHKDELDLERLAAHFHEMVSYDVAEERLRPNIDDFLEQLREGVQHD